MSAVLAAIPAIGFTTAASAQYQTNTQGTALDANNRIGSGGVNTYRAAPSVGVMGNNIVTGNVGGGKEFHGRINYSDPTSFEGFAPGKAVDDFTKNSVGVGAPYSPPTMPSGTTAYFGASRFAAPPPGQGQFAVLPNSGGAYVAATPDLMQSNDLRLGAQIGATDPTAGVPRPGELILPGPVDPTGNQTPVYSASPLAGVRQLSPSDVTDLATMSRFTGMSQQSVLDRLNLNSNALTRIQQELRMDASPALANAAMPNANVNAAAAANAPGAARGTLQTLENPVNNPMVAAQVDATLQNGPLGGALETQQTYYNRVLGTPQQQSKQYDELKKRLDQYEGQQKTTAQTNTDQFNKAMRDKAAAAEQLQAKSQTPGAPGASGATIVNPPANAKTPPKSQELTPLSINTLTSGVQGKGLKEMLGNAESLMKQGKYSSAIEVYGAAEAVAPNQPLIWIGRANAELGAAYYNRAEAHLKQAFTSDQALLMGQYDLRSFLGEDRLQSIIKDLKEIANGDPKATTPLFLLAYISYNTGNESRAAGWLDLAEKRSEGKDPTIKMMREHWSLSNPTSSPTEVTPTK
jgi:tetratricopeptide (TPR) repeat protein